MHDKIIGKKPIYYHEYLSKGFAAAVIETNIEEYKRRSQTNVEKIQLDIYFGKLCEFIIYSYFQDQNIKSDFPDLAIYGASKKSYGADLTTTNTSVHVKSCLDEGAFPNSWLFQPNDPLVKYPKQKDILALCVYTNDLPYFYFVRASEVEYKSPIKQNLNKKVIYERDLLC